MSNTDNSRRTFLALRGGRAIRHRHERHCIGPIVRYWRYRSTK